MIKEIKYNGFTETPSDYECPDGDLATIEGLVPEDKALRPILTPTDLFTLPGGYNVVFIHKNTGYKHYIIRNNTNNKVYWIDEPQQGATLTTNDFVDTGNDANLLHDFSTADIHGYNAIGNTLVITASDGMHYILWKNATDKYKYLGTHLPELPISFGLQGDMIRGEEFSISFSDLDSSEVTPDEGIIIDFDEDHRAEITPQVLGKVNKFIAQHSVNDGKFMFPFFVRYAYRLYDQSLTMHSAPVLMVCSSDLAPQCFLTAWITSNGRIEGARLRLSSMFHKLDYEVKSISAILVLRDWSDIVKSVDFFVSKPIYSYDQNGEVTKVVNTSYSDGYCICEHTNQDPSLLPTYPLRYQKNSFTWLYRKTFEAANIDDTTVRYNRLMLPMRDNEDIKADIRDNAQFYLLKSISVNQLSFLRTVIPVSKEYLQSLTNREVMSDDYDSHDAIIPKRSFVYNSRLNVADITKSVFTGFDAFSMFPYTNGYVAKYEGGASPTSNDYTLSYSVKICINQDGKDIVVQGSAASFGYKTPFLFIFYPNINAYKAILIQQNYLDIHYYEVPLEQHPMLNGAYYLGVWEGANVSTNETSSAPSDSTPEQRIIDMPNKIYTSEVNNPFYFPALGINTVGTGTILGISSAVKALSQGQFGQFPLYAFTNEGVWALELSDTGTFKARQPVSRDVCFNPDSITRIDTAVLFATKRGIMLISGSNTSCISDTINSDSPFNINALYGLNGKGSNHDRFLDYINNCSMLYDYTHQRIVVYNPGKTYAYIYSLKSKMWSTMPSSIKDSLNSYPDALAQIQIVVPPAQEGDSPTTANKIINYSEDNPNVTTGFSGVLVTRPLKLDAPDLLKTVNAVIQRGHFRKGHVKSILYGSRDLFNWHPVYSSVDHYLRGFRGTPYKYFRIALLCTLDKDESVYGCTVQYTPRLIDQPR